MCCSFPRLQPEISWMSVLLPQLCALRSLAPQVYCCNHASTAHFNPAVTWGVAFRNGLRLSDVGMLIAVTMGQILGALLAGFVILFIADKVG